MFAPRLKALVIPALMASALLFGGCSHGSLSATTVTEATEDSLFSFALPNSGFTYADLSDGNTRASARFGASAGIEGIFSARAPNAASPYFAASSIEELIQLPDYPSGCEVASLACVLRAYGFNTSIEEIFDFYMPMDESFTDFVNSYGGSPYISGGAFPPAIVSAANAYLAENSAMRLLARDISGKPFSDLVRLTERGVPVLVWTTISMQEPEWDSYEYDSMTWYMNEHCVVMYGAEGDGVLVMDPLEGMVERNRSEFAALYRECGSMAVALEF